MTSPRLPRLAEALVRRLAIDNEPLAGDLVEEFQRRKSRVWLWRQLIAAFVVHAVYAPHPPVGLNLTPTDPVVAEWLMCRRLGRDRQQHVSLTGTGIEGIGGLTMVMLGTIMSMVVPAIWWFVIGGIGAGVALGVFKLRTRNFSDLNAEARRHGVLRLS